MNLYEKLVEVRKSVSYLQKDQSGQGIRFKYVSSSQTLGAIRNKIDELKILLIPTIEKIEVRDHATKNGTLNYFTLIDLIFTWINAENPKEQIACKWHAQGIDSGEKGPGKAYTYAEKYFILKFFNIPTDQDDPDRFAQKTETQKKENRTQKKETGANKLATEEQRKILIELGQHKNASQKMITVLRKALRDKNLTKEKAAQLIDTGKQRIAS